MNQLPVRLPYRFISITGPDAQRFLQGQCSTDLGELDNEHFSYGTLNTPKGRMYALFKIVRLAEGGLLLSVHESLLDSTLATLKKYAVFFKCQLEEASYFAFGYRPDEKAKDQLVSESPAFAALFNQDPSVNKAGEDHALLISLPGSQNLHELWRNEDTVENSGQDSELESWLAHESLDGIPQIYEETREQFILQELNLQELGAVSFKKGCYTGQEIIARMKFLGKLKKRMFFLKGEPATDIHALPGSDIFTTTEDSGSKKVGKKVGKLVRVHKLSTDSTIGLAVLNKELVPEGSTVYMEGHSDTSFSVHSLQYES